MTTLFFITFNPDGTIRSAHIRDVKTMRRQRLEIWEALEWFQVLTTLGYEPIERETQTGEIVCTFTY